MSSSRNRFADVTPDEPTSQAAPTQITAPPRNWRSRYRWLIVGVGLVAVSLCGLVVVHVTEHHSGGEQQAVIRAAHGPVATFEGVPVGYTRDEAGAATAAVNTIQALTQAGQGRVPMSAVVAALIARDPGPHLRASIEVGAGRGQGSEVVNMIPAAVTVKSFSPLAARVSIWTMTLSRGAISTGGPVSVITAWSTHDVDLVWQDGDWKVKDTAGQVGPTPDEQVSPTPDSPLTQQIQSGYYSFYVN
ncbi:hypothetical protein [Nocardia macrotermitis]|uniref:DUF8175 domain-containing protein n=1 Tax=Nocardia macrotermitis TaxID=2585198 RepID=A0A7K0D1Y7_9NOCA|nr:hypothetical protein [Nocardia macrotermitis]MQY18954.1 hypothetical protein [Nocardia macrotermitis]